MRFAKTLPMAKFKRAIAVGALLAVSSTATGAMNNAYAATGWSAVTEKDASFLCVADCQAGGVGPVRTWVQPPQIGAWERTVVIRCKVGDDGPNRSYHLTVNDKNWAGLWMVARYNLVNNRAINDAGFPQCS